MNLTFDFDIVLNVCLSGTWVTMSRPGVKNDGWVRIFEVPCFEKHEKGYTVYKIVSRVSFRPIPFSFIHSYGANFKGY